jgi:hypothetical protein
MDCVLIIQSSFRAWLQQRFQFFYMSCVISAEMSETYVSTVINIRTMSLGGKCDQLLAIDTCPASHPALRYC